LSCAVFDARQKSLVVRVIKNARQSPFTVQKSVVRPLPCVSGKKLLLTCLTHNYLSNIIYVVLL
jgi:hypothetical protein